MVRKANLAVFESTSISKTVKTTPIKIGVHACYTNPYVHEFFELIPINQIFWWPWTIVHGPKGKFGCFWEYQYLQNHKNHAHQNQCTCMLHQFLHARIFGANSNRLNFWWLGRIIIIIIIIVIIIIMHSCMHACRLILFRFLLLLLSG